MKRTFLSASDPTQCIEIETPYGLSLHTTQNGKQAAQAFKTAAAAVSAHTELIRQLTRDGWREEASYRWFRNPATGARVGVQPPVTSIFKTKARSTENGETSMENAFETLEDATRACCARVVELLDAGFVDHCPSWNELKEEYGLPPATFVEVDTDPSYLRFEDADGREFGPERHETNGSIRNGLQIDGETHGWSIVWHDSGPMFQMRATVADESFGPHIKFTDEKEGYEIFWRSSDRDFYRALMVEYGEIVGSRDGDWSED